MATEKLFTVVGTSIKNGTPKVRWANDLATRIKAFARDGQTDVRLVQLPEPMSKYDAVQMIVNHEDFQDDIAQQAIDDYLHSVGAKAKPIAKVVEEVVVAKTREEEYAELFADLLEVEEA